MSERPRDRWPESTLALLRDLYQFISKQCRRYQSDLFARLPALPRSRFIIRNVRGQV
jgi:hypothetical protein